MSRSLKPFHDVLEDVSGGSPRLPQSQFAHAGRIPVIDQGQRAIAGYTDDEKFLFRTSGRLIVFGDHTRIFKFVDFPFAVGADGVKVLRVREGWSARYVFHFLRYRGVAAAGYSRHFKYLKEVRIPWVDIGEQERIAAILDRASELIGLRRGQLEVIDRLESELFRGAIGEINADSIPLGRLITGMRNGVSPSSAGEVEATVLTLTAITSGRFIPSKCKQGTFRKVPPTTARVLADELLICRGNGNQELVGVGVVPLRNHPDLVFPDTVIAAAIDTAKVNPTYLEAAWRQAGVRAQIRRGARTTNGIHKVNQAMLAEVVVPLAPIGTQNRFARDVRALNRWRETTGAAGAREQELFNSCARQLFRI